MECHWKYVHMKNKPGQVQWVTQIHCSPIQWIQVLIILINNDEIMISWANWLPKCHYIKSSLFNINSKTAHKYIFYDILIKVTTFNLSYESPTQLLIGGKQMTAPLVPDLCKIVICTYISIMMCYFMLQIGFILCHKLFIGQISFCLFIVQVKYTKEFQLRHPPSILNWNLN